MPSRTIFKLRFAQSATFTHLLKDRIQGNLDEESAHMFDFVLSSVERMKRLIQGMLELARINERAEVANVQVETLAAVQLALRDLDPAIEATGAKICIDSLPRCTVIQNKS